MKQSLRLSLSLHQVEGEAGCFNLPLGSDAHADSSSFALVVLEQVVDGERPHKDQADHKQVAGKVGGRRAKCDSRVGLRGDDVTSRSVRLGSVFQSG